MVNSLTPREKEEAKIFKKNVTECAKQANASTEDVHTFIRGDPQKTKSGKCLIACILKRNEIIVNNKINKNNVMKLNRQQHDSNPNVIRGMDEAMNKCFEITKPIKDVCEYASAYNDCMTSNMDFLLSKYGE